MTRSKSTFHLRHLLLPVPPPGKVQALEHLEASEARPNTSVATCQWAEPITTALWTFCLFDINPRFEPGLEGEPPLFQVAHFCS